MPKTQPVHKPNPKYAENMVADRILELLDSGQLPPWDRPWSMSRR